MAERRAQLAWTAGVASVVIAVLAAAGAGRLLFGEPGGFGWWCLGGGVVVVAAFALARGSRGPSAAVLAATLQLSGVVVLAAVTALVVIGGWEAPLHHRDRVIVLTTGVAALATALLAVPLRLRLRAVGRSLRSPQAASLDEAALTVGARMSRALPMEEVLRQLAETLRSARMRVEIWTGTNGELSRAVSVPSVGPGALHLGSEEQVVIARARVGGPAWTAVWLPELRPDAGDHRVVPIAHLGELLGLLVLHRPEGSFTEPEEDALVDIARRLGLALHNVQLDSALQASLAELAARNAELESSRRRIVTAADASRREIERDLHDGAQQRLVALAVQLGLAVETARDNPAAIGETLQGLRAELQATVAELRELAHGIYPPLLRDRGLNEALRAAAARSGVRCDVVAELPGRYDEAAEAAVYFCCLEALQNCAKYGGSDVTVQVHAEERGGWLSVDVLDDGPGFDPAHTPVGQGLTNMRDRVGALGGHLDLETAPGAGTRVRLRVPVDQR